MAVRLARFLLGVLLLGFLLAPAHAADFPTRPVKLIVPFAPGGATDIIGRLLGERLTARWGQAVIIENKPGAGTIVGTSAVVNAPADGHTIGIAISAHVINPSLHANLPYDTLRDLAGVSLLSFQSIAVTANPGIAATDVRSLVDLAKTTPGGLDYASPGVGTMTHLAGELFSRAAGVTLNHIPYNGGAPATTDVVAGRVPVMFDIWYAARPHVEAGRLKVIGFLDAQRLPGRPNDGTFAEVYPGLEVKSSLGLIVRSATPRPLIEQISQAAREAVQAPDLAGRMRELGLEPIGTTAADYDAFIRREIARWKGVIEAKGIKAN
ncbi:MAG: tripartite tricarboxylate transporter substrate binding protein [Proteobacteria bacterium]|nr:tripartite tricarboxylate transporter substrate binding protein [Pseudomonadota bacterium]